MALHIEQGVPYAHARLTVLADRWANCRKCPLSRTRNRVCFGVGATSALIMVISARPNKAEEDTGLPMQSEAARIAFDAAMYATGLQPGRDLFGTWAVKCITPKGEDGFASEIPEVSWDQCKALLHEQITAINPAFVVLQGKEATKYVLGDSRSSRDFLGHIRKFGHNRLAMSTHNPAGLFGEREYLMGEYIDHWRELCYRIHYLGRTWRPDAPLFASGWTFSDPALSEGVG